MLLTKRRNNLIRVYTKDSSSRIRLMNNMYRVPTDLNCLLPCAAELEKIKTNFMEQKTCDDLKITNRNFYHCYIRYYSNIL